MYCRTLPILPSFLPYSLSCTVFGDMLKAQEEWYPEKEQPLLSSMAPECIKFIREERRIKKQTILQWRIFSQVKQLTTFNAVGMCNHQTYHSRENDIFHLGQKFSQDYFEEVVIFEKIQTVNLAALAKTYFLATVKNSWSKESNFLVLTVDNNELNKN